MSKNVTIQNNAFIFCRYTVAVLVWVAFALKNIYILGAVFLILLFSALLKIQRAPMIVLYTNTIGKIVKSKEAVLDERAMWFAHALGTVMAAVSLLLVYFWPSGGWYFVIVFALLKTISALGFCPAYKLFGCMSGTSCCRIGRFFK